MPLSPYLTRGTSLILPSYTVAFVVNALVVSSIRYGMSVYGTCGRTQLHRVQKLLNFCARVISGRRKYEHISGVLKELKWLSAEQMVKYHQLCLLKSVLANGLSYDIAEMFTHVSTGHNTRQTGQLSCPRAKTGSGTRRFVQCGLLFNGLPPDLIYLRMAPFKRRFKQLLLSEAA